MQTLDPIAEAPDGGALSPAAARNAPAILAVLADWLPGGARVLEVASGTGQHAAAFTAARPDLDWTASDPSPEALASIRAWRPGAEPLRLDVLAPQTWPEMQFDALFCANMIHIAPPEATAGLMTLASRVLTPGGALILYGPLLEPEVQTAASNLAFDADLKRRDPRWGLRQRVWVEAEAAGRGLTAAGRRAMPANNVMLLFRKSA